jgi:hypothetical protein
MQHNKVVQFEIWSECNNACPFCYLRKQMKVLNNEQKISRIQTIIDYVSNDENMKEHDGVGIIGGELFQGQLSDPKVKAKWIELMSIINKREEDDKINNFWVASALLREDLTDCFDTIDCFTDKSKVLLCTSYDTVGRFINEEQRQLWFKNIGIIREKYPDIKLHSQIVCTQHFIEEVLSEKFPIEEIRQKYKMRIDLSDPWVGYYYKTKQEFEEKNPNFFPKRKDFIKFIRYLHKNTTMNLEWLFSGEWFAETLFTEVEGELKKITNRHLRQTDLPLDVAEKSGYIDSNINMRDDVLKMIEAWKRND